MTKYKPRRGDVVRLSGDSANHWFSTNQPYLVKNYPSRLWDDYPEDRWAPRYVDIVNLDGSPPKKLGTAYRACANLHECHLDQFLTAARRACGLGVPKHPGKTDENGWAI